MGFFEFEAAGWKVRGVACSFCGQPIEPGEIDPVELSITARCDRPREDGLGSQLSWCHSACLENSGMTDLHVTSSAYWAFGPGADD
jgi:hypothetical protein